MHIFATIFRKLLDPRRFVFHRYDRMYRDVNLNLRMPRRVANGLAVESHICEVQVTLSGITILKKSLRFQYNRSISYADMISHVVGTCSQLARMKGTLTLLLAFSSRSLIFLRFQLLRCNNIKRIYSCFSGVRFWGMLELHTFYDYRILLFRFTAHSCKIF